MAALITMATIAKDRRQGSCQKQASAGRPEHKLQTQGQ
jgi:hypothetical protein